MQSALDERETRIRELEEAAAQRGAHVREPEAEVARLRERVTE